MRPVLPSHVLPGPVLHVCVTCRAGRTLAEGETPPGAQLHAALLRAQNVSRETIHEYTLPELREVTCLAACSSGCTATIAAPGKWRVLLGNLDETHATDLLDYAGLYAASPTGMVLPSKRAPSLRNVVLGRIPA